jgi:ribosomal protein S27AE
MDDPDTCPAAEQYDWAGIHDICPTCGAGPYYGILGAITGKSPRYGYPPAHSGFPRSEPRWWCGNCEYGPEERFWTYNPSTGRLNPVIVRKFKHG